MSSVSLMCESKVFIKVETRNIYGASNQGVHLYPKGVHLYPKQPWRGKEVAERLMCQLTYHIYELKKISNIWRINVKCQLNV